MYVCMYAWCIYYTSFNNVKIGRLVDDKFKCRHNLSDYSSVDVVQECQTMFNFRRVSELIVERKCKLLQKKSLV